MSVCGAVGWDLPLDRRRGCTARAAGASSAPMTWRWRAHGELNCRGWHLTDVGDWRSRVSSRFCGRDGSGDRFCRWGTWTWCRAAKAGLFGLASTDCCRKKNEIKTRTDSWNDYWYLYLSKQKVMNKLVVSRVDFILLFLNNRYNLICHTYS